MCGIVGLAGHWPAALLTTLNNALAYRGPDDAGEYSDQEAGVALAMRRLSILDLTGGHQPMQNEDGSVRIVFNGEIYNAPELRQRLLARGHRFQTTHSDTECLLHLYEDAGENMLAELNGMFAFVIYDRNRQRLFGARDRFGIKPLYYTHPAGHFACASELKPLLLLPTATRDLNLQSLAHYLSLRYIPGHESIFQGIYRIRPAHSFCYDLKTSAFTQQRYWRPDFTPTEQHSAAEWAEIVHAELRAAVRRWTLSDVPIACSLSGGLDSSAIVGLLSEMGYADIRTYSLGFRGQAEKTWSELPLARKVAEKWGTKHHELFLTSEELLDDLIPMIWHLDEPYGGGLPSWSVYRFMSQDVKVGLTGTGGDELFGNYGKWQGFERSFPGILTPLGRRLHRNVRRVARKLPTWATGAPRHRQIAKELYTLAHPMATYPFLCLHDASKTQYLPALSSAKFFGTTALLEQLYDDAGATDIRNGIAHVDLQTQLPDEFLLMTDRFSMAFSLEARVPFLDHVFAERMLRIPSHIRTQWPDVKALLKKAIGRVLPDELLSAPKQGFVIPENLWLQGKLRPLAERLLAPERLRKQGLFQPALYHNLVRPYLDGASHNSDQVWTLLMFQLWHSVFIEYRSPEPPTFSWRDMVAS